MSPAPDPQDPPGGEQAARERGPDPQVLVSLAGLGALAFNFPLLAVWDSEATILGLPLLPVALFGIWAALVAALAVASERRGRQRGTGPKVRPGGFGPPDGS